MSTEKMYTLKSSDKESFEVEESVAMMSQTIKHIIEDDCSDNGIPLPNVTAKVLAKVLEYCKKHKIDDKDGDKSVTGGATAAGGEDLKGWDKDFANVDQAMLFDLILAANYLNIKDLLDLMCRTVADMMRGKSPEEIRETFHIKNDYTPEEEAEVRKENAWAFE